MQSPGDRARSDTASLVDRYLEVVWLLVLLLLLLSLSLLSYSGVPLSGVLETGVFAWPEKCLPEMRKPWLSDPLAEVFAWGQGTFPRFRKPVFAKPPLREYRVMAFLESALWQVTYERQESLQIIADSYFGVEMQIRNVLHTSPDVKTSRQKRQSFAFEIWWSWRVRCYRVTQRVVITQSDVYVHVWRFIVPVYSPQNKQAEKAELRSLQHIAAISYIIAIL